MSSLSVKLGKRVSNLPRGKLYGDETKEGAKYASDRDTPLGIIFTPTLETSSNNM